MAFSGLCHISNVFKSVENETDLSECIMDEENFMVRDLITKVLDETGPPEPTSFSSMQQPDTINNLHLNMNNFPNMDTSNSFLPAYNFNSTTPFDFNKIDGFNLNAQNGYGANNFASQPDAEVSAILGVDLVNNLQTGPVSTDQLYLLKLAAQEIGGAQFTNPPNIKFDDYFEPNQRNSLPEINMFSNYNCPNGRNGINLDMGYNSNYDTCYNNNQVYPNKYDNGYAKDTSQESAELLSYLSQLNIADRISNEPAQNEYKMPMDMSGHYQNDEYKLQEERNKMLYNANRSYQQMPNKYVGENNYYPNDTMSMVPDRNPIGNVYDFANPASASVNPINYKPNGFQQQNEYQRRDMNPMVHRESYQSNGHERSYDTGAGRENPQQALMRQQELARQMSLMVASRPPTHPLNVDVSFLHEANPYLGLGALLGPNAQALQMLPSPLVDMPILAPYYAIRNVRGAATASSVLHTRLDACYEQWRQLERERKRTEARLALAYPGRAVSSSNSIPVPRLPPCPTRVDRLTVDMLREHTKVLTLMGKMETLRASVCVAQNKRPNKPEDPKITVLRRGQDNVTAQRDAGREAQLEPNAYDPASWREDVKHLSEIAPHSEVESAMLSWRNAVSAVQAARRRELAAQMSPPPPSRYLRADPIFQLADAVRQLCVSARRARCAMWCDLTLTVALAPPPVHNAPPAPHKEISTSFSAKSIPPNQDSHSNASSATTAQTSTEEKATNSQAKTDNNEKKTNHPEKQEKTNQQRRTQNYRNRANQGRSDFYQKNQRYENRYVQNRHPYHYLATGPIN